MAETVNIRKSCSETADKVGTVFPGETLEIVMQQADGWTRVKYNGQTGYVKTEVLKVLK
ncbi:MAG: SH3 domain-containing protein [Eisenbergiella sp.]